MASALSSVAAPFLLAFLALVALNLRHLADPPYWDAVTGVYSQGVWLLTELTEPRASLFGADVHLLEVRWSLILFALAIPALPWPALPLAPAT